MPVKPDRNDLHAWLTPQLMRECEQALHRHGMDTATIPYAWQTMQHLHARIEQHAEAIVRDLTEALQALETHRQQAGLTKVFLSSPVVRSCYAACPSAAHKVIKVLARDRVYAVTSAESFPTEEEARQLWQEERRALRPYDETTSRYLA